MTGAGNDFVVIDNRSLRVKNGPKTARLLCDRRWGIGADGLILVGKSRRASYKMMYYNADGSYGGMCGNGGRCIAVYAVSKRIARKNHTFEALKHIYSVTVGGKSIVLTMKDPKRLTLGRKLRIKATSIGINFVDTGAPHVVIPVGEQALAYSLEQLNVTALGRVIRYHEQFSPSGTNVNFIERSKANTIRMRTYERGVEDETLACGTGSIASAIVASQVWRMKPPITVITRSGVPLKVAFNADGPIRDVRLTGPAKIVFTGTTVI